MGLSSTSQIILIYTLSFLSSCSQIEFIILFPGAQRLQRLSPASANCANSAEPNLFPEPNWHILSFIDPILLCRITY
jgi:hypothetical protein